MNADDLRGAIALGEQRGTEFKGPGARTDKPFQAVVIRAMLGMANKRDGGVVVIGVDEDNGQLIATGLSSDQEATWNFDDLASNVTQYADPYVDFEIDTVEMDGKSFVVIDVRQFAELPVICKRSYNDKLRKGALYVRGRGKNETVEVPSHVEMREVVHRAAEYMAREMVASHEMLKSHKESSGEQADSSKQGFDDEVGDLL